MEFKNTIMTEKQEMSMRKTGAGGEWNQVDFFKRKV